MRSQNDTPPLRVVQRDGEADDAMQVEGVEPLLPEDQWIEARYLGHETKMQFKVAKVVLKFQITEPGPHFGRKLERHFRARKLLGKPGENGRFVLNQQSDLFTLMVTLLDEKGRPDRISLRPLRHMLFKIQPRVVKHDHRQAKRPEATWYTVVGEIQRGE